VSKGNLNRRVVLRAGVAGAAGLGLGAWGSAGALAGVTTALRQPGSLPYPALPAGTDTIPQIEHIVVVMMENHSYDNRLGTLRRPGADGFQFDHGRPTATNPYANGDLQHAFRMPTTCQLDGKPSQEWTASHQQFDSGSNDGFVTSPSGPVAMGYWDTADQPFYHSLARTFPIADRYFCSLLGQTYPNRRYLIAATSIGQIDDTTPGLTDYPKNGTIFDALDAAGITWKDYYSSTLQLDGSTLPAATALLYPPAFFKNPAKILPVTGFFFEPDYGVQSEENPQNVAAGEAFVASVVNAVMSGPKWPQTLLIWTYDEHGGYYDHVQPPAALAPDAIPPMARDGQLAYNGFAQYGFRVPFAIISPYARPAYVSHQVMDHTSICALVEYKWNLPAMTVRDANALPPLDMLDFSRAAFAAPPALAQPLLDVDPSALACNVSGPGTIPPPGSVTPG
jgi:phospholipase C